MARQSRRQSGLQWRIIIFLLFIVFIAACFVVSTVLYYGFNWKELGSLAFYENLANPSIRIVKIQEGWRKEEVAEAVSKKLNWTEEEKQKFIGEEKKSILAMILSPKQEDVETEGKYFPKTYMLNITSADPEEVSNMMFETFQEETQKIKIPNQTKVINQDTALIIASIIQREAAGKQDMRLISGIIWNRLFKGMKLQIDATIQYAKGTEDAWWPQVKPEDKKIDSPYNTYKYWSLPPGPIANPGLAALSAAYNPEQTNCLFYLHDKKRRIHCSSTYQGHLNNIDKYY